MFGLFSSRRLYAGVVCTCDCFELDLEIQRSLDIHNIGLKVWIYAVNVTHLSWILKKLIEILWDGAKTFNLNEIFYIWGVMVL